MGARAGLAVHVALVVFVVTVGAWGAFRWSLIPLDLAGTIAHVEFASETGYRLMDVTFEDGRTVRVDRRLVDLLGNKGELAGAEIHKAAWGRTVVVGHRREPLSPSAAFWDVLATLTVLATASLLRRRFRSTRE